MGAECWTALLSTEGGISRAGILLLKQDGSGAVNRFVAMFAPNFGGGAMEPKSFADRSPWILFRGVLV
jgi:hypothetical protein